MKARKLDKNKAKLIKASIYASKNLCYHLDGRHKITEDGYSKTTDAVAWGNKIKEFVQYKLDTLKSELSRYLRDPMCVYFPRAPPFTFGQSTTSRLRRVMSAYTDDRPYSLDLVSAVSVFFAEIRPRNFIRSGNRCNDRECSPTRWMICTGVDWASLTIGTTRKHWHIASHGITRE